MVWFSLRPSTTYGPPCDCDATRTLSLPLIHDLQALEDGSMQVTVCGLFRAAVKLSLTDTGHAFSPRLAPTSSPPPWALWTNLQLQG